MSDDDFYGDDFHSEEESPRAKSSTLMPIVEVPSETGSISARSSHHSIGDDDHDDISDEESLDDDDDDEETYFTKSTSIAPKKTKKRRSKNSSHVDMTPPDVVLQHCEKKARKYAKYKKKHDQAMQALIQCTALARIVYGDGHWKLAEAYANLAEGYADIRGYYPQAQQHAEFARDTVMKNVQMTSSSDKAHMHICLVKIYYILGRAMTVNKKYNEAVSALAKAEKLCSKLSGSSANSWSTKVHLGIGRLNGRLQKYALSITHFEKALELLKRKHGDDSPELISVYQNLSKVEQCKGDMADQEKAVEYMLQAHSISSAKYKENSEEIAETAASLAATYANIADGDAQISAESYFIDALTIYQSVYGPHYVKTIQVQDDLGRLMIRTEKPDEGIDRFKSNLEAKKEVYGDLSEEVADSWKLIGSTYLSKGDMEKALRALKKCHTVESSVYGTNNRKTKDTQRTIDLLMANPNLASKQKKTKADELKERPRFSSIIKKKDPLGGCKPQSY